MKRTRVLGNEKPLDGPAVFRQQCGNFSINVGHHSHLGYLAGAPNNYKSTIIRYWIAAALMNESRLTFDYTLNDRCVLLLDGEQPEDIFNASVREMYNIAGGIDYDDRLQAHSLTGYTTARERQAEMWNLTVKHRKELGLVILDGGKNFISNFNDIRESTEFINNLLSMGKRTGCQVLVLSHITEKYGLDTKPYGMFGTLLHDLSSWGYMTSRSGKYIMLRQSKARYGKTSPLYLTRNRETKLLEHLPYMPF